MSDLADRLDELPLDLVERLRVHQVPGASLAVLAGEETWSRAAGLLNLETGVEATPDSVFQIGSITKVLTATLVMQLVDEGRLRLDTRVVDVLPGFTLADPDAARRIRIEHLLAHTSGIDGDQFLDAGRGHDAVARWVERCGELGLVHAPGALFSYCNAGFVIAGRIVEVLRGAHYDAVLRERLLAPLGLDAAGTLPEQAILHRVAAGHSVDLDTGAARRVPVWSLQPSNAPAGSTAFARARELVAFARMHLAGGRAPDGKRLLSERAVRAMQDRRVALLPGSLADAWGLGWAIEDWSGGPVIGHSGTTLGQRAWLAVAPQARVAVALLTNGGDGRSLRRALFEPLFRALAGLAMPAPAPVDEGLRLDPERYVGTYARSGARIAVERRDGGLAARVQAIWASLAPEPSPRALRPIAPDLFRVSMPDSRTDACVGFLDPEQTGRAAFLMMEGRAHPRVD